MTTAETFNSGHGGYGPPGRLEPDAPAISFIGLLNILLRHRLLFVLPAVILVSWSLITMLTAPRSYTSAATFMPGSGNSTPAAPAGLAAQLGFSSSQGEIGQSPDFYIDLLKSREILRPVIESKYSVREKSGRTAQKNLMEIYETPGATPAVRETNAIAALRSQIDASASLKTSIITLKVTAPDPVLAKEIADQALSNIVRFNRERRQSSAKSELDFTARRLSEISSELRDAENRLQEFQQQNREYRASPKLNFDQDRIAREVSMRQQVYTTIAQAYENAKIDEVREATVITIIEKPEAPVAPDPRGVKNKAFLNLFLGLIIGLVLALVKEYVSRTRDEAEDEFAEFARLRAEMVNDIRHPLRRIARSGRARQPGAP